MYLPHDTPLAAWLLALLPCIACSPGASSENADGSPDGRAGEGAAAAGDGAAPDDAGSASDAGVPIDDAGAVSDANSACPYYLACHCYGGPFDASFTNDWDADVGELRSQADAALATCNDDNDSGGVALATKCASVFGNCLLAADNLIPTATYTPPFIEQVICDGFFTQPSPALSACLEAGLPSPPWLVPPDQ